MDLIKNIQDSVDIKNKKGYKTKNEVLKLYDNVHFHKSHVSKEIFGLKNQNPNIPDFIEMITICLLVMSEIVKGEFVIDMFIAEMYSFPGKIDTICSTFETMGTLLRSDFDSCFELIKYGIPIWPNRKKSDNLYPEFTVPKGSKEIMLKKRISNKKKNERKKIKKKEAREAREALEREEEERKEYIKKYGEFDAEEVRRFLRSRWEEACKEISAVSI
jgi:hypothetical protein